MFEHTSEENSHTLGPDFAMPSVMHPSVDLLRFDQLAPVEDNEPLVTIDGVTIDLDGPLAEIAVRAMNEVTLDSSSDDVTPATDLPEEGAAADSPAEAPPIADAVAGGPPKPPADTTGSLGESPEEGRGLEVLHRDGYRIIVNRNYPDPDIADQAVAALDRSHAWAEADVYYSHRPSRKFFVDDAVDPVLLGKGTNYEQEGPDDLRPDGIAELVLAPEVRKIVMSDQAQQIAQAQGYEGIVYNEPVAVLTENDSPLQVVVSPFYDGVPLPEAQGKEGPYSTETPTTEIERADAVVADMIALFGANKIDTHHLDNLHFAEHDGWLHIVNTDEWTKFEPAPPAVPPNEIAVLRGEQWQTGLSVANTRNEYFDLEVPHGSSMMTTQQNEHEVSALYARNQGGCVFVLSNPLTGEGAVINAPDAVKATEDLIQVLDKAPNLNGPGTIMHLIGGPTVLNDHVYGTNVKLSIILSPEYKIGLTKSVITAGDTDVTLNPVSGRVDVYDESIGDRTYFYTPPGPIPPAD